jgi:hypothetical protein
MIPKLSPDVDSITIQPTYEVSHIYSFLGWLLRVPLVVGELDPNATSRRHGPVVVDAP